MQPIDVICHTLLFILSEVIAGFEFLELLGIPIYRPIDLLHILELLVIVYLIARGKFFFLEISSLYDPNTQSCPFPPNSLVLDLFVLQAHALHLPIL